MSKSVCPAAPPHPERPRPRLALTAGEPAGIGAELVVRLALAGIDADLVAIGDPDLIAQTVQRLGVALDIALDDGEEPAFQSNRLRLRVVPVPLAVAVEPGRLDARNARYVLATLERAADGASSGEFDAIVTAPLSKAIINDADVPFTGHTEFFADRAGCEVVMMLVAERLRVALATTHLPLSRVPAAITRAGIMASVRIIAHDLRTRFGIAAPRIAVLGLNPHAGESGHLGREEIDTIIPAIAELHAAGIDAVGPLPADTAFVPAHTAGFDAILAMYHDQGLPVLKYAGFGHAVNVTLGLPYIRTSVDHGTALDIAGSGRADPGSLIAATRLAIELAARDTA